MDDFRRIPRDSIGEIAPSIQIPRREFLGLVGWRALTVGAGVVVALEAVVVPALAAGTNQACGTTVGPPTNTCKAGTSGPTNACPGTNTCSNAAGTGNFCTGGTLTGNSCSGNNNCGGSGATTNTCSGAGSTSGGNACDGAAASNLCNPGSSNACTDSGVGKGNACGASGFGTNTCKGTNSCVTPSPNWCGPTGTSITQNTTAP